MNAIDQLVAFFNPEDGVKRLRARALMSTVNSYTGASRSRRTLKEWVPWLKDADRDTLPDRQVLVNRSRDLSRNNPIALGAINTKVLNVVGDGLKLQSKIDYEFLGMTADAASDWQRNTEREFHVWSESQECDAERTLNFYGLQELAFRSVLTSGDVFALLPMFERGGFPYQTRVQLIEGDRISNPNHQMDTIAMAGGVEKDSFGAPVAYHIQTQHPGSLITELRWNRVPAFGAKTGRRNVIHLYPKLRPHQSRGIPDLAPVIETLKQLDRYTEAELMAAVVTGMFAVFFKTESAGGLAPMEPTSDIGGSTADKDYKLQSGIIGQLSPGESIETVDPNRPNIAFDPFMQAILRQVGVALELPFEVLIKHFTASYSASRAAMMEAWRFFRRRRKWLGESFNDPIYRTWLMEAVASGRIHAPGYLSGNAAIIRAYSACEWVGPAPGHIDPLREAKAEQLWVDMGVKSLSRVTTENTGSDWEDVHNQRKREVEMRRADGLQDPAATDSPNDAVQN